ncbi:MAG: ral substrate transporter, partial [Caulobacteraceae bacterium]|nr:ral substrate transporter [Caulobacteraceae bacterium]
ILATVLNSAQIDAFGWRIALVIGALVLPFGLWARRSLPETLHEADSHPAAPGDHSAFSPAQLRVLACSIAILVGGSVATAIQSYLTTYSGAILHMEIKVAFLATVVYGLTGIVFNLVGAVLSDRIGRRPVLIVPRIILAVIILPAFAMLARNRDGATLALITAATTALASTAGGVLMGAISESLRKASRSTALALIYAVTVALVGGTTQVLVTFMIRQTGDILWPAYYYIGATLLALAGAVFIRESAPRARR